MLVHYAVKCSRPLDLKLSSKAILTRAVTGGKTAKTEVLPGFCRNAEMQKCAGDGQTLHCSGLASQKSAVVASFAGFAIDPSFSVYYETSLLFSDDQLQDPRLMLSSLEQDMLCQVLSNFHNLSSLTLPTIANSELLEVVAMTMTCLKTLGLFMSLPNNSNHQIYQSDLPLLFTVKNVY